MGLISTIRKAKDVVKQVTDQRPEVPDELRRHWDEECVMVYGAMYHADTLQNVPNGGTIELRIRKNGDGYRVETLGGEEVGVIYAESFSRNRLSTRGTVTAEVYQPTYAGMDNMVVYIRLTEAQIKKARAMEELKLWFNIDGSRWEGGSWDVDAMDASVWVPVGKSSKPTYMFVVESMVLFRVTPRMHIYPDIEERVQYKIRRLIAEQRDGANGTYWHVGLYF